MKIMSKQSLISLMAFAMAINARAEAPGPATQEVAPEAAKTDTLQDENLAFDQGAELPAVEDARAARGRSSGTRTTYGNTSFYSRGGMSHSYGGTTFYSRGGMSHSYGGTTFYSRGGMSHTYGGTTFYSRGGMSHTYGGTTFYSNGGMCHSYGGTSFCN